MRSIPGTSLPTVRLSDYLASQPHAFARDELTTQWSRHQLDVAMGSGTLVRVLPGVYAAVEHWHKPVVIGEALNLWAPRAIVTGALALHLLNPGLPAPPKADLLTANGDRMHPPPWVRVHQAGVPQYAVSASGVRCAVAERALLDTWRLADPGRRRAVLYEALWARVCTWRQLHRELARAPRVAGRRDLERVLGWFAEGATTPLEVHAKHSTFADAPCREFEWQVRLPLATRNPVVDMVHRAAMVVVELDGDRYHASRVARDDDRERQTDLVAAGYAVIRFGWRDVVDRPQWCRERLLGVVSLRHAAPGSR